LLRGIIVILKDYPSPNSIRILFDLLKQNNQNATGEIISTLLTLARQNRFSKELLSQVSAEIHKISQYAYQLVDFLNEVEK